ncbi:MAG TPA: DUF1189 family protein [Bacillaceae bacterium]
MRGPSLFTLFYKSLYSPKEIAKFRFLGIGKIIQYIFLLMLFSAVPGILESIGKNELTMEEALLTESGAKWIMLPLFSFFTYIFHAGFGFIKISVFAYAGVGFARMLERKVPYRQSWRIAAFSLTLPTILSGLLTLAGIDIPGANYADWAIILVILYASIKAVPKPKIIP